MLYYSPYRLITDMKLIFLNPKIYHVYRSKISYYIHLKYIIIAYALCNILTGLVYHSTKSLLMHINEVIFYCHAVNVFNHMGGLPISKHRHNSWYNSQPIYLVWLSYFGVDTGIKYVTGAQFLELYGFILTPIICDIWRSEYMSNSWVEFTINE